MYWLLFVGPLDSNVMVLHRCNNKACVNPEHLKLGSHKDNMQDVADGQYHPRRKLTQEQAREIRESKDPTRTLARQYNVSQKAVQNLRRGLTYREFGARNPKIPF